MDTTEYYFEVQRKLKERKEQIKNTPPLMECCGNYVGTEHRHCCINYNPNPNYSNRIVCHYPSCWTIYNDDEIEKEDFNTADELLNITWVKSWKDIKDFYQYSISDHHLMAEFNEGKKWWVIGYIKNIDNINLPKWIPVYDETK